ncbi:MAG: GatB/YqeY domain-containing protein [Anaerolineae bacterium]|nr:GatB/YqeY domain-containing protein [Anaerolineae bacterium]
MSDPRTALQDALKQAMISKDNLRRDVIRMTLSEIKQVEIDERKTLTPEEMLTVLQREVKKRRESVEEASKAGRDDIAGEVEAEIRILETFLPEQLSREAIAALVKDAIAQTGATSAKDMGKVMGALMPKVKGKADGKLVNEVVRELLS